MNELAETIEAAYSAIVDIMQQLISVLIEAWETFKKKMATELLPGIIADPRFMIYEKIMVYCPDWFGAAIWWLLWSLPNGWFL